MIEKRNQKISLYNTDPLQYRGTADSGDINEILNNLKSNALKAILRSRKTSERLDSLSKAYFHFTDFFTQRTNDLEYKTGSLIEAAASGLDTSIISMYDNNIVNSGVLNNATADVSFGQLTLSQNYEWSKVTRYTDNFGDLRPTPDLKIFVDDSLREPNDQAYNCLDSLSDTLWIEDTSFAEHTIRFDFPKGLQPKLNALEVSMFPQYAMRLETAEYLSLNGSWRTINNTSNEGISIKRYFSPNDFADKIRLKVFPLSSTTPLIGLSNFDAFLIDYINNGSAIFEFPEVSKYTISKLDNLIVDFDIDPVALNNQFSTLNPIRVTLNVGGDLDALTGLTGGTNYEIPFEVLNGTSNFSLNTGTITQERIFIQFNLTEINQTTPVVRGAVLNYTRA